jgi:hypothetical protein
MFKQVVDPGNNVGLLHIVPEKHPSPAQKPRTSVHVLHPEGRTRELAIQFQQLCVDMAVKDQMSPGHWAVNSVILRIYSLHEIERRMTSAQMLTMIKSMTVYLGTTTPVPS